MDGNVTWIDTELDANVGFFSPSLKKKYLQARRQKKIIKINKQKKEKKRKLVLKGDEPWCD